MVTGNATSSFQRGESVDQTSRLRCCPHPSEEAFAESEEAFAEDDPVAVEQHNVVLTAVDDLLEVVAERLLCASDDALENDALQSPVGRAAGGGKRLKKRGRLRAAELHAARVHHLTEDVDVD